MQPIRELPCALAGSIRFFLCDIDDTMTENGLLPASSLGALEDLQRAGIKVIPVTGRPAGWCDHIARMWPVDAVVGENGALWLSYDRASKTMLSGFAKQEEERLADRARLDALKSRILKQVPGAGIASDQFARIGDLAIDFCEDVPALPQSDIAKIVHLFEAAGATAKVSSIHVNGWFGAHDKLSMTRTCLMQRFGVNMDEANAKMIFVGDSPNDQPMFAFFQNSVGVANVRDFELATPPVWVTQKPAARGFAELVEHITGLRQTGV
jgi:HAD superfamily hydrolase (TIGR01484 family)